VAHTFSGFSLELSAELVRREHEGSVSRRPGERGFAPQAGLSSYSRSEARSAGATRRAERANCTKQVRDDLALDAARDEYQTRSVIVIAPRL
jgi:hypothetical protein